MVIKFDSTLGSKLTTLFNFKKTKKMEEMFLRFLEYCVTEDGGAYILVSAILLVVLLLFAIIRVLLTPFMNKIEKLFEDEE